MQSIETACEDRTVRYTQLARQGDVALYRQEHKASKVSRFEVVRIRLQPEHRWPDGTVTPLKEAYPASGAWGRLGWTFFHEASARRHLSRLCGGAAGVVRDGLDAAGEEG